MRGLKGFSVMVMGVLLFGPAGLQAAENSPGSATEPAAPAKPYLRHDTATHRSRRSFQNLPGLGFNPEMKGFNVLVDENNEARLNARIQDLIGYKPPALSPGEKTLQGIYGAVSAACGVAAMGQVLGVLPDGRQKKK